MTRVMTTHRRVAGSSVACAEYLYLPGAFVEEGVLPVRLNYASDSLRVLCTTRDALISAWGDRWTPVGVCIQVVAAAASLADVATFAALTLVFDPPTSDVTVEHHHAELLLRAVDGRGRRYVIQDSSREALMSVTAATIVDIHCDGQSSAQALGA